MVTKLKIDDGIYQLEDFSDLGKDIIEKLMFTTDHIKALKNNLAVLNRAKNSYIEDLKLEAIEEKSGINLADLFSSD